MPYPGLIKLQIDATDLDRRVFHVKQQLPVRPGRLTLLFPRFLPGTHGPYGQVERLAGLMVMAAAKPLPWQRDTVEPHAQQPVVGVRRPDGVLGPRAGRVQPLTYTFDDVVNALNQVPPFDWRASLRERLDNNRSGAPLDGLFRAGLSKAAQVVAVNGVAYKEERLSAAITANKSGAAPLDLLVKEGDNYRTLRIDYRGGLRYPRLERIADAPERLDAGLLGARP